MKCGRLHYKPIISTAGCHTLYVLIKHTGEQHSKKSIAKIMWSLLSQVF